MFVLIGYGIAEYVDERLAQKARWEVYDKVLDKWKPSKDNPEHEENENGWYRARLTDQNNILAGRIGELLVRMR